MSAKLPPEQPVNRDGWWTREHALVVVLVAATILLLFLCVGQKLRLHTVPVFFAILGGLAIFGASGLILGPVILALTDAIPEIRRRRTAGGRPAEAAPVSELGK